MEVIEVGGKTLKICIGFFLFLEQIALLASGIAYF